MVIIDKLSDYNNIDTLIFDIDGTITRWKSVENFLKKSLDILGVPYSPEALSGLYKAMEYREYHALITSESDETIYSALLDQYVPALGKYGVTGEDLKNTMFALEASETFISEEVPEEIKLLSESYKLYCYTNWFRNQAIKKLEEYNLRQYFSGIYSSEDTYVKYSKVGFLYILNKHQLAPSRVVHIGDSKSDVVPSHDAGIHSIYLDYSIKSSDDITAEKMKLIQTADASITEFRDIRRVLTKRP